MCKGMKKCKKCAAKSIGKMAKKNRKTSRRRRRVGAISKGEAKVTGMDMLYTVGGILVSKGVNYLVNKSTTTPQTGLMKYAGNIVSVVGGGVAALSKNRTLRVMGLAAAGTGIYDGLSKADILPAAVKGIGAPRLGAPRVGSMPSPTAEMQVVQG